MRDFEWTSEKPLQSELVARGSAGFGIFFAVACIFLVLGYLILFSIFFVFAIGVSIYVIIKTPPTRIKVDGNNLYYGSSMKGNLNNLKKVKLIRQFGVEEVISLRGPKNINSIPTKGIPDTIKSELRSSIRAIVPPSDVWLIADICLL